MSAVSGFPAFTLADGIVYGPVASRRLGRSLGVNVLPFGVKVCGFNCSYCQCGWTYDTVDRRALSRYRWPTPEAVGRAVADALRAHGEVDAITFSGNGEPTLNPWFADCVRAAKEARDLYVPAAKVVALTNGARLDDPAVVEGLNELDERMVKLDAGTEAMFLDMNTPTTPLALGEILAGIARLRDVIIQSLFTRGRIDNTKADEVNAYAGRLADLRPRPKGVHIYTIARAPADPRLAPAPREVLEAIARRVRAIGIPAEVF
jgi:wyosine [tRNA(Phe)-imidazoG37] synthetase (radical SAM superfamily)